MENRAAIKLNRIPEIYCAIFYRFKKDVEVEHIAGRLREMGISDIRIRDPRHEAYVYVDFAIINNESFWELGCAMNKMFAQIDGHLPEVKDLARDHGGTIYIDVAFYQYGTYPTLELSGENMEKIRCLNANVRIEPYATN